jgi:predicted ribosomally synthesized peptide with nif11-like leader
MTIDALRALVARMSTDAAFRDGILAEGDPDARLAMIAAAGFDCSRAEIAAWAGRLDDAELDEVAAAGWDCRCLNEAVHGQAYNG